MKSLQGSSVPPSISVKTFLTKCFDSEKIINIIIVILMNCLQVVFHVLPDSS